MSDIGPVTRADITAEFIRRATLATSTANSAEDNVVALLNLAIECGIVQATNRMGREFGVLETLARTGWIDPKLISKAVSDQLREKIHPQSVQDPKFSPDVVDESAEVTADQAEALKRPPKTVAVAPAAEPPDQVIPNAVGRLDDVVAAIADQDPTKAVKLLWERGRQIEHKRNLFQRNADQANAELRAVLDFAEKYSANAGFRKVARAACGGPADES